MRTNLSGSYVKLAVKTGDVVEYMGKNWELCAAWWNNLYVPEDRYEFWKGQTRYLHNPIMPTLYNGEGYGCFDGIMDILSCEQIANVLRCADLIMKKFKEV